jgi:hypothetical protein
MPATLRQKKNRTISVTSTSFRIHVPRHSACQHKMGLSHPPDREQPIMMIRQGLKAVSPGSTMSRALTTAAKATGNAASTLLHSPLPKPETAVDPKLTKRTSSFSTNTAGRVSVPSSPTRAFSTTPAQAGIANFFSTPEDPVKANLKKFVSREFTERIVSGGEGSVQPRHPDKPVSREGMHAIAAYTSGGLNQKLAELHIPNAHVPDKEALEQLEDTIQETILSMAKTPADEVRRNTALDAEVLAAYQPGAKIGFDRITSVTTAPTQAYSGGNVDFVIKTKEGVVSVDSLSDFSTKKHKSGESEGILDPSAGYEVVSVTQGREKDPSTGVERKKTSDLDDAHFPPTTIVLKEI